MQPVSIQVRSLNFTEFKPVRDTPGYIDLRHGGVFRTGHNAFMRGQQEQTIMRGLLPGIWRSSR